MEEEPTIPPETEPAPQELRCPDCDSVVPPGSTRCIMCGAHLPADVPLEEMPDAADSLAEGAPGHTRQPAPFVFADTAADRVERKQAQKSRMLRILIVIAVLITAFFGFLILRSQGSEVMLALQPTFTPIPPAPTLTPTWTPQATETPPATATPIPSATPVPTDTPRPPRFHSVAGGETLFGLSLLYRVSTGSIAEANGMQLDSPIQVGQELGIPWPTATPPLESMVLEVGGETIVVDATDCEIITIQEGDSTYGLSAQRGIPAEAIVAVNRLTEESIQLLHPGDTLCMPRVSPGDSLPPTAGPQPTVTATAFPAGPSLLYPVNGAEIDSPDELLRLQWLAVKDLEEAETYMVEMTDLDQLDSLPYRAFTRDNSFKVPLEWRPEIAEAHEMRWRVSIVRIAGERSDGGIIYEYGGRGSEDSFFLWMGVEPTPTPTPTLTPLPTPVTSQ